ncbi:MAG: hypothetical protein OET79_08100, partial [Nitrospirota bacterium]|nr:hypothetical protein [Nitrospirota bacterium]
FLTYYLNTSSRQKSLCAPARMVKQLMRPCGSRISVNPQASPEYDRLPIFHTNLNTSVWHFCPSGESRQITILAFRKENATINSDFDFLIL